MALDGSGHMSQVAQLDVAFFKNYATGLFTELDGFFLVFPNLPD